MRRLSKTIGGTVSAGLLLGLSVAPAAAQSDALAEIEAMVDGSATADMALTAARKQARSGDVSGAATTLERALIGDPDALPVRATYIGYLCQLDDQQAAQFEIGKLAGQDVTEASWATIKAACGPETRPAPKTEG